ncbi:hypothetical protein PCYB_004810, partial [Plasmodium cynomolgi strain B]
NLILYKLYDVLNREGIKDKDIPYCKGKQTKFNGYNYLYELCKMFEKNLRELPTIMSEETDKNEQCRYLIFWLNDQMRKKFNLYKDTNININLIMQQFSSVSHLVNNDLSNNQCKYYYMRDITMELWKKWKDLYNYIRNKNEIEKIIVTDKKLCKIYKSYHTYITSIYADYQKECCNGSKVRCPLFLKFDNWCYENDILTKLKCNESDEIVTHPVNTGIYNATQSGEAVGIVAKQGGLELEERGSSGSQGESGPLSRVEPKSSTGVGILTDSDNMVSGPIRVASQSILNKNVGTIGATLAGSTLFTLMMYKVKKHILNKSYHFT